MAFHLTATAIPTLSFPSHQSKPGFQKLLTNSIPRKRNANYSTLIRCNQEPTKSCNYEELRRCDFPLDFMFGASSSAIQTEGFRVGQRGQSTWDSMVKHFKDDPTMDLAIDSYHHYKEDVQMLKDMSADCYRFSISWSRILPQGKGEINQDGINFYNNLINELVDNGIVPIVTLFHYDLPQALHDSYNGFMNSQIVEDFTNFAEICFKNFGDRVKYWTTFNEPQIFSLYGNTSGSSDKEAYNPYQVMHHILLAHAKAYKLYKDTYQKIQGGEFGFPLIILGFVPFSSSAADKIAAKRATDFYMGWILMPLTTGDYPFSMRCLVKDKLLKFTDDDKKLVKGSFDFITVNYYTSRFTESLPYEQSESLPYDPTNVPNNQYVKQSVTDIHGNLIGPLPHGDTFANLYPQGLKLALLELKYQYGDIKTFISENGVMEPNEKVRLAKALKDDHRIAYLRDHLTYVKEAIEEGANVKAYCYWSLLDSLELGAGNTVRMGLHYTDYENGFKRIPKDSAKWFGDFLRKKC